MPYSGRAENAPEMLMKALLENPILRGMHHIVSRTTLSGIQYGCYVSASKIDPLPAQDPIDFHIAHHPLTMDNAKKLADEPIHITQDMKHTRMLDPDSNEQYELNEHSNTSMESPSFVAAVEEFRARRAYMENQGSTSWPVTVSISECPPEFEGGIDDSSSMDSV